MVNNRRWTSESHTKSPHTNPSPTGAAGATPILTTVTQASTTYTSSIGSIPLTAPPPQSNPETNTHTPGSGSITNTQSNAGSNTNLGTTSNGPTSISGFSSTIVPVTVSLPSTTFVTSSASLVPANSATNGVGSVAAAGSGPVCIGQGVDVTAIGVLSSVVLCSVVGLLLWLLFAYLRPKFRQIYSVREWFVAPELRPKPLSKSFWGFLWPPVPLVPSVPKDVSSYSSGNNPLADAALFPSDEELAQRTLWHAFLLVLGWTLLGLGGALPLYLVDTPCVANSALSPKFGGKYSTLQDLSLMRLLNLLGNNNIGNTPGSAGQFSILRRATVNGTDVTRNTEIRLIVLAALVIVLAALPAIFKLLHEFTRLANYRRRWIDVRCDGLEMGWLSKERARGFDRWGENKLKEFIIKTGLSMGFKNGAAPREGFAGVGANGRSAEGAWLAGKEGRDGNRTPPESDEKARPEVDLQGLFTIADTTRLAGLIEERDMILNNLEVAETRYIISFKLSTPTPSVVDFESPEEPQQDDPATTSDLKHRISRPRALSGSNRARPHHRPRTRSHTTGSAPTAYVAPSSYYKLRDVRGVGKMSSDGTEESLAQRISQRVIGSRFQEIHRDSYMFGRIPLGSHVQLDDKTGTLGPVRFSQDQLRHGPNDPSSWTDSQEIAAQQEHGPSSPQTYTAQSSGGENSAEAGPSTALEDHGWTPEWTPTVVGSSDHEFGARPRPARQQAPPPPERRSTFAMRSKQIQPDVEGEVVPPPHLRLQPQQPFVRPVSGMDHDDLGVVYSSIREWRSRLKAINVEIAEAQAEGYNYIAEGVNIKGWLLVGRGVRFLPGIQMIEGRSKEDIRYGELQVGGGVLSDIAYWTVVGMVTILLGASLVAVSGLVLGSAPDVAHFLSFLQPLSNTNSIGAALATTLAPAVAATLFIALALFVVHYMARYSGAVSVTSARITAFKGTFFILTVVCCVWLIACGSVIFALEAIATSTERPQAVASGSIYFAVFLLVLVINVAIISPALLMLQPLRLWRLIRRERSALTPRQRFRAIYPRTYDPSYATACCLLAVTFAATFSLIFPLIGPAVCLLLFLTLIAHRYLIGYVYARTDSSHTGGLLQMWLLRRFANLIALQPLLLGLIILTQRLWILGGILVGAAVLIVFVVEAYANWKTRLPSVKSLSPITLDSLANFKEAASPKKSQSLSENPSFASSPRRGMIFPRSSMASVLEMMSLTLAVMPSGSKQRGPVPLPTEDLNDLTATEKAARTSPDAPPRLPPLPFTTHSEEMQGILYAPELIAPPPIIWLPNDRSGVAQSEAYDLQRWHDLTTTLDISPDAPRQQNESRRRDASNTL